MSKLSLYESKWINLVFENKNKEYGAFQLRQESTKTSLFALFMGLLLCTSLMCIPKILLLINPDKDNTSTPSEITEQIIEVTKIFPNQIKKTAEPVLPKAIQQKPIERIDKKQLINPTIVKSALATPNIATNLENNSIKNTTSDGTAIIGSNTSSGLGTGTGIETGTITDSGNDIVTNELLDKKPQFPGGMEKFYTYVGNKFITPTIDDEKTIRIYVSFVVEKDGSMTDIQVRNNPGYGLEKEAIRVLKSLKTKWIPGMIGSKPVRTAYNLPIAVQIN